MSARFPFSESRIAEDAAQFADRITPSEARWRYCFERVAYHRSAVHHTGIVLHSRTIPVVAKVLGISRSAAEFRLQKIRRLGFEEAFAWGARSDLGRDLEFLKPWFWAGPMQAWHVGHIYFARVETHPHVVKVGFSRRVRERLEDISSRAKVPIDCQAIHAGTLADEHWWHRELAGTRISGEWFFDARMPERSLPAFLADFVQEAA